jgi:hypothetical protein
VYGTKVPNKRWAQLSAIEKVHPAEIASGSGGRAIGSGLLLPGTSLPPAVQSGCRLIIAAIHAG